MRSVKVVGTRIYAGFYMNFGYWLKNANRKLLYISLSDKIKDKLVEDEQFWKITHLENHVLFQSLKWFKLFSIC